MKNLLLILGLFLFHVFVYAEEVIDLTPTDPIQVKQDRYQAVFDRIRGLEDRITKLEEVQRKDTITPTEQDKTSIEKPEKEDDSLIETAKMNHQILKDQKDLLAHCASKSPRIIAGENVELYITINQDGKVEHIGLAQYPTDLPDVLNCFIQELNTIQFVNKTNEILKFKEVFNLYVK